MESYQYQFPHWKDKPPEGFPFETSIVGSLREHSFQQTEPVARVCDLGAVYRSGNHLLELGDDIDALWKFENCLLICEQNQAGAPEEFAKYATSCAMTVMKISAANLEDTLKQKKLLTLCELYCEWCLEKVPRDSCRELQGMLHYCKGENLQQQNKRNKALHHYQVSFQFTRSARALSRIIILKGDKTKDLLKVFDFKSDLTNLLQLLLQHKDRGLQMSQIEYLIKFSRQANAKKFISAAKEIPHKIGEELLKYCQEKTQLLQEIVEILSYSEDQVLEFIREVDRKDDEFCCHLLNIKQFRTSQKLMEKLSVSSRSHRLWKALKNEETEQGILLLHSGEIQPEMVDLSRLSNKTLDSRELLLALLAKEVNPQGLSGTITPLIKLVSRCPNRATKSKNLDTYIKTIENIRQLIDAGANVEDLNAYHSGHKTTPIHVATEMAVTTGEMAILKTVHANWQGHSSSTDGQGRTALHVVAIGAHKCTEHSYIVELWRYLVQECKTKESVCDDTNRLASYYLPDAIQKQLNISQQLPLISQPKKIPAVTNAANHEQKTSIMLTSEENNTLDLHMTVEQNKETNTSSKKLDLHEDSLISPGEKEIGKATPALPSKKKTHPKSIDGYSEEEVEQIFKKRLFIRPGAYFISKTEDDIASEQDSDRATVSISSLEKERHSNKWSQATTDYDLSKAPWTVEVSEHFRRNLKFNSESIFRKRVLSTIKKLAEGCFDSNSMKKLKTGHSTSVIFEARINDMFSLLYTLLDRFSERDTAIVRLELKKQVYVYKKTIIVLDISKLSEISHDAERASKTISTDNTEKLKVIVLRNKGDPYERALPQFSLRCDLEEITDEEKERIKLLLNTNIEPSKGKKAEHIGAKMYSLTIPIVLGSIEGGKNEKEDYPIKVEDDEFDIIEKSSKQPIMVLGRSGTGKTTVCLCRMWKVFIAYWNSKDRENYPLVPRGRYLRLEDLQEESSMYCPAASTHQDQATPSIPSDAQKSYTKAEMDNECEHIHQVFITKNGKLCGQMRQRFNEFVAGYGQAEAHKLIIAENKELPKSFSNISELCFPLFLTARQFFLMLDKSLRDDQEYFQEDEQIISSEQPVSDEIETLHEAWIRERDEKDDRKSHRVEVTASYFQQDIWPKIEKHFKGQVDPFLIWMEIQSFIKGSLQALQSKGGILSQEDYDKFGLRKRALNFPMKRSEVYTLFEAYNHYIKHKDIGKRLFDNGDFIYNLYSRLPEDPLSQSWSIHYVYIDEVQDFTQAELSVIVRCCRYPNGFFFAGDTAQTIIRGIAFRFEDLTSIFHSEREQVQKIKAKPIVNLPDKSCQLTINHRSHRGITNIAATVTDLLQYFFEKAFDWVNIPRDSSNMDGPDPLFLWFETISDDFFKLKANASIQFGANQVVIVREAKRPNDLPKSLEEAIVLTVEQCKGLEFNDVLLYNFFTDFLKEGNKMTENIWRASTLYLKENPTAIVNKPRGMSKKEHPFTFEEQQHKTLCAELKYLYTAITRARSHLWIYESSPIDKLPMLDYWLQRGVVKIVTVSHCEEVRKQLEEVARIKSTSTDWKKRGDDFTEKKLWNEALKCYREAGETLLEKLTKIQILQGEVAASKQDADKVSYYRLAAVTHLECDQIHHDIKQLKSAAVCLSLAGMHLLSAQLFEKLCEYDDALEIYGDKLNDLKNYTRLKEELGEYKDAVFFACAQNQCQTGLQLVKRFEEERKLKQPELYEIARELIGKWLKTGKKAVVSGWLQFIVDEQEKLCLMKKAELYSMVFSTLDSQDKHVEAFRYAKANSMFTEAIAKAKKLDRIDIVTKFELQQFEEEILSCGSVEVTSVPGLEKLATMNDPNIAAKANLLLAKNESTRKHSAITFYEEANRLYKMLGNKVGEFECFHTVILRELQENLHLLVKETITSIHRAEGFIESTGKKYGDESLVVHEMVKAFHNVEVTEERSFSNVKYYCIPKKLFLWVSASGKHDSATVDSDGMFKIEEKKMLEAMNAHVKKCIRRWKKAIEQRINTVFQEDFAFHDEIKQRGFLQPKKQHQQKYNMEHYTKHCELQLQLLTVHKQIDDPTDTLLCLLSPFSQLIVHLAKEDYITIRKSTRLCRALWKKVDEVVNTSDRLLVAWQILSIIDTNNYTLAHIKEQTESVNEEYKHNQEKNYKAPLPFRLDQHSKMYRHTFSYWLESCELLKHGTKALFAIETSLHNYMQHTIKINDPISIENTITILSIHTTALLAMLTYSYYKQKQEQAIVPIPETFQRFMLTFHWTNCHGESNVGVSVACLETAKKMEAGVLQSEVIKLLKQFLSLLTGKTKTLETYHPIKHVFENTQLQSGEPLHCLVLTLTILGNLALVSDCDPSLNTFLLDIFEETLHCLDPIKVSQFAECIPETFKDAHENLLKAKTAQDIFQVLSKLLADTMGMNMLKLCVVKQGNREQIEFSKCHSREIPNIPLGDSKNTFEMHLDTFSLIY